MRTTERRSLGRPFIQHRECLLLELGRSWCLPNVGGVMRGRSRRSSSGSQRRRRARFNVSRAVKVDVLEEPECFYRGVARLLRSALEAERLTCVPNREETRWAVDTKKVRQRSVCVMALSTARIHKSNKAAVAS